MVNLVLRKEGAFPCDRRPYKSSLGDEGLILVHGLIGMKGVAGYFALSQEVWFSAYFLLVTL